MADFPAMRGPRWGGALIVVSASMLSGPLCAQSIYKSVDGSGVVSYGDKPASGAAQVREVLIEAGPSDAQVREAQSIADRIRQSAEQMEVERLAREKVTEQQRKTREMEAQFQAELEAEIKQADAATEAQRQALLDAEQKKRAKGQKKGAKARPKGPVTNSDKAINMRPNAPLLNLPGPAE